MDNKQITEVFWLALHYCGRHGDIPPAVRSVMLVLLERHNALDGLNKAKHTNDYMDKDGYFLCTNAYLIENTGSSERSIREYKKILRDRGLVEIKEGSNLTHEGTKYRLNWEFFKLEKLLRDNINTLLSGTEQEKRILQGRIAKEIDPSVELYNKVKTEVIGKNGK